MNVTYCYQSIKIWNFTPETQLSIAFLLLCIDRMLNFGLKSQHMVLHANLQSEMVLTVFAILFGVIPEYDSQQLIILKVFMIETRCLQFCNSQVIIFSKHGL